MAVGAVYFDDGETCWDQEVVDFSISSEPVPSVDLGDDSAYTESSAIQDPGSRSLFTIPSVLSHTIPGLILSSLTSCAPERELTTCDDTAQAPSSPVAEEGDVFGKVAVPLNEGEYYFYTKTAIYHTEDYGETIAELSTSGWSGDISTLAVDTSGNLYLGTSEGVYLSTDKESFTKIITSNSENVNAIYPRSTESILVGTDEILLEGLPENSECNSSTTYITNGYCFTYHPFTGRDSYGEYYCNPLYVYRFIPKWNRSSDVSVFTPEVLIVTGEGTFYSADAGDSFEPLPSSATITHGNWMDTDSAYFWDGTEPSKLWTISAGEFLAVEENLGEDAGIANVNDVISLGGRIYIATDSWVSYKEGDNSWELATSSDLSGGELPPVDFLMGHESDTAPGDYEIIGLDESLNRYHLTWTESE